MFNNLQKLKPNRSFGHLPIRGFHWVTFLAHNLVPPSLPDFEGTMKIPMENHLKKTSHSNPMKSQQYPTTMWGPQTIAKLVQMTPISLRYGLWYASVHGVYKPTNITGEYQSYEIQWNSHSNPMKSLQQYPTKNPFKIFEIPLKSHEHPIKILWNPFKIPLKS